jgi:spore maturation protein A
MLNYIWVGMLLIGIVVGILNGRMEIVTQAAVSSAGKAVELCIGLLGIMCLWTGLMEIAQKSGMVEVISRGLKPVLRFLLPKVPAKHPAMGAVVMNLTANFLGLGNAATPLGIKAMNELQKLNSKKDTATDAMCMFLVLNTTAIQLIPSTIIALRSAAGSQNPAVIIGPIWIASAFGTAAGIIAVKMFLLLGRRGKR